MADGLLGMVLAWVGLSAGGVLGVVLMLGRWAETHPRRPSRKRTR